VTEAFLLIVDAVLAAKGSNDRLYAAKIGVADAGEEVVLDVKVQTPECDVRPLSSRDVAGELGLLSQVGERVVGTNDGHAEVVDGK